MDRESTDKTEIMWCDVMFGKIIVFLYVPIIVIYNIYLLDTIIIQYIFFI